MEREGGGEKQTSKPNAKIERCDRVVNIEKNLANDQLLSSTFDDGWSYPAPINVRHREAVINILSIFISKFQPVYISLFNIAGNIFAPFFIRCTAAI